MQVVLAKVKAVLKDVDEFHAAQTEALAYETAGKDLPVDFSPAQDCEPLDCFKSLPIICFQKFVSTAAVDVWETCIKGNICEPVVPIVVSFL